MSESVLSTLEIWVVYALWIATIIRIPIAIRLPRSFAWWIAIFLESLSMTIAQPSLGIALNRYTGIPNIETLFKHLLFIAFEALVFYVVNIVNDKKTRRSRRIIFGYTACTGSAITILFYYANDTAGPYFLPDRITLSPLLLYWLTYLCYIACVSTVAFLLFWRSAHKAESKTLRISLGFLAIGFAAGVSYAVLRLVLLISDETPLIDAMRLAMYTGLLCFVIGSLLPTIPDYAKMVWSYRSRLKLYPLWSDLLDATPSIALAKPRGVFQELSINALDFRIYRRVIEIRDGLIALRKHISHDLPQRARQFALLNGVRVDELDVTVAACVLEVGRRAKLNGDTAPVSIAAIPYPLNEVGKSSLGDEVNFLCRLAKAHRNSIVRQFADTVSAAPGLETAKQSSRIDTGSSTEVVLFQQRNEDQ
jgi:hypothetical protein